MASHVSCGRVDGSGSDRHDIPVADGARTRGTQPVPRRETRPDPLRAQQVGVGHGQRLEDVLTEIAVQRLPAHVFDELAEGSEAVVAVGVPW
jgi:hypothetical protein